MLPDLKRLCQDTIWKQRTYCEEYNTEVCEHTCHYARKKDLMNEGIEESLAEEFADGGTYHAEA